MTRRNCLWIFALLIAMSGPVLSQSKYDPKKCDSAPSIGSDRAEGRLVSKGAVVIPPLAKATHVQGNVRIEVCVSESGEVVRTKLVNGHPLLVQAAVDSAEKWRFKADASGPFKTILEISFSQGGTPSDAAAEEKVNNQYFDEEGKCREQYRLKEYDRALVQCKSALALVERLPKDRFNERRLAHQIVGHVYYAQREVQKALDEYNAELQIALSSLPPDAAELAYAYHDVAISEHTLGRVSEAAQNYSKAERTLSQARDHIQLDELKPKYSVTLGQIREHYLILLQQTGQTAAAGDLEKRIQAERK
jgi:tetratricopeptide (TPR) repeat protein